MKNVYASLFRLKKFTDDIARKKDKELLRNGITDFVILVSICTLIVIITAIFGNRLPSDFRISAGAVVPREIQDNLNKPYIPWVRLLFPLTWIGIVFTFSFIRFTILRAFDEKNFSLRLISGITCYSVIPFIIAATFVDIMNDLFPLRPYRGTGFLFYAQLSIASVVLFSAWIREGYSCIKIYQVIFLQNRGRAFFTWFSPYLIFSGLFFVLNQILILVSD